MQLMQFNGFMGAYQWDGANNIRETTVNLPGANHGSVDYFANTLGLLNDGLPTTLNDNAGPVGPADVTWALQWDMSLAARRPHQQGQLPSVMILPNGGARNPPPSACWAAARRRCYFGVARLTALPAMYPAAPVRSMNSH